MPENLEILSRLAALSTSVLADATKGQGLFPPGLLRFSGIGTAVGRAVTADCDEGSLQAVFSILADLKPGDFLVVGAPGDSAYLGEILATHLVKLRLAGAIINGFIRDHAAISVMPISFFARGLYPYNQRNRDPGRPMIPVKIGVVSVHPDDWIVADDDGVICIAHDQVEEVLNAAECNVVLEARILQLVCEGASPPEAVRKAMSESTIAKGN